MTKPKSIRTTSDGCVQDADVIKLAEKPIIKYRVQTYEGPVVRSLVLILAGGRSMLADIVTGTLYDPQTGRSNTPDLILIGKAK